jgi:phosphoribosylglycinamide formyltransferase-1
MADPLRLLVLVSGSGTNLQALLDGEKAGRLQGRIVGVVSDREDAYALERARAALVPAIVELPDRTLPKQARRRELSDRILSRALSLRADAIVFAGFLSILEGPLIDAYAGAMINLHPSLLPKFGGAGMFGEKVHAAVLAAGERESGCTVHLVDAGTDTGPVLLQRRVPVLAGDTPGALAERIHVEEHIAIVEGVAVLARRMHKSAAPRHGAAEE